MEVMQIREQYLNATKGHWIGDSGWYEPYTDDRGELFRTLQKEYGRCVSKMYREYPLFDGYPPGQGHVTPVGWVFERTEKYTDTGEPYVREVWVEVKGD